MKMDQSKLITMVDLTIVEMYGALSVNLFVPV